MFFLETCEQISVNFSNASADGDEKIEKAIGHCSVDICDLMITDNDPVDSMPLKLGETKPTSSVDIIPGTFLS